MSESKKIGIVPSGECTEKEEGLMQGRIARLAWLPIPLLFAAIIAARAAGLNESYESRTLTLILSLIFYTLVSLGTLFLVSRSFLATGKPGFLMLACGVILWSLAGTVGDAVSHGDANINVTIFNTGILLAGICHLAGAALTFRQQRTLHSPSVWLGAGFMLTLIALWFVARAALGGWLPVFFIPGRGGTTVRFWVLLSAIAMFVLSASLLLSGNRRNRPHFTSWYARALLLLSVGLFGVMIQLSLGSVVNWLGRTAQWLGGFYLLLSAFAAIRASGLALLPRREQPHPAIYRYFVAVVAVIAATALRLAFLSSLTTQSPFLTFYPAVVLAALYGGLRAGLLTTVLSVLVVDYFWLEPAGMFSIGQPSDWVTAAVFSASCILIAIVTEALHSARTRASAAETEALLAVERMEAAERLRETEGRYHALFTGMTEGFAIHELITDEAGKPIDYLFLDINPAFENLTGLKRRDVVGRTHNEVLPGDDDKWLQMYAQVSLTGNPVRFENYSPALKRHYEVFSYRPAPMQFAVTFVDVTARKQMEAERERLLAQVENQAAELEATISSMANGLIIYNVSGKAIRMNNAAKELLPQYVFFHMTVADRARVIHWETEEELPYPPEELPTARALRGETVRDVVIAASFPDHKLWLSVSTAPIYTSQDKMLGVVASFIDITKRKQAEAQREAALAALALSEEKFSKAFAINPAAIALTRLEDGIFIEVNDTWVKLNGYSRDEVIGQSARKLSIWPEAEAANNFVRELKEKGLVRGWEQKFRKKSGEVFIAEVSAQVLTFQGEPIILSTLVDITARKHAEDQIARQTAQLQERTAQLEHINKELESFSYSVSHDLRAPLRAIDGFSRMILKNQGDKFDEDTKTKFNVIRENAQKMGQLIDDLLNLSRLGKQDMKTVELNMAELTNEVWKELQIIDPKRIMKFTVGDMPHAFGDRTLIRQVYLNLIGNAIKFTKQTTAAKIEAGCYTSGNEHVYYIKDNGAGFDMEYYKKLFGVFQRLHSTDEFEGTGVGLAIVQRIIHRHGGRVWAEGELDKGATFYFALPCK